MDLDDLDDLDMDDLDDMDMDVDDEDMDVDDLDDIHIHIMMGPCDSFLISQVNDEDRVSDDDDDKTDHLENNFFLFLQIRPKSAAAPSNPRASK